MLLDLTVYDPKADRRAPPQKKALNSRYIVELEPIMGPASADDDTLIPVGTSITMHTGKKHTVQESLTVIKQMTGGGRL